jgi:hypothetical protein
MSSLSPREFLPHLLHQLAIDQKPLHKLSNDELTLLQIFDQSSDWSDFEFERELRTATAYLVQGKDRFSAFTPFDWELYFFRTHLQTRIGG